MYNIYAEIIKYLYSNKDFLISFFDCLRNHNVMALKMINEIFNLLKIVDVTFEIKWKITFIFSIIMHLYFIYNIYHRWTK